MTQKNWWFCKRIGRNCGPIHPRTEQNDGCTHKIGKI